MGRLRIVLVSAALVAGFALAGPVRADEVTEDLPWWAQPDYEEQAADIAAAIDVEPEATLPEPAEAPVDPGWWAGGPDAVLVLAGGETPSEEPEEDSGSSSDATSDEDDGGRNPLFNRADGHRAGEDPGGTGGGGGSDPTLEEERDDKGTNECRRLPTQIARYKKQLENAGSQISASGRAALEAQIHRLEQRQQVRCPESIPPSTFQQTVAVSVRLLAKAARIAAQVARYMYGSPF